MQYRRMRQFICFTACMAMLSACTQTSSPEHVDQIPDTESFTVEIENSQDENPDHSNEISSSEENAPSQDSNQDTPDETESIQENETTDNVKESASESDKENPDEVSMLLKSEHFNPSGELIYSKSNNYIKDSNGTWYYLEGVISGDPAGTALNSKETPVKNEYDDDFKHKTHYYAENQIQSEDFYIDLGFDTLLLEKSIEYLNGNVNKVYYYEYDSNGKMSHRTFYFGSEESYTSLSNTDFVYENGLCIEEISTTDYPNGEQRLTGGTIYEYDSHDNLIKKTVSSTTQLGTTTEITDYEYNDHNDRTHYKTTTYYPEGSIYGEQAVTSEHYYEYAYEDDSYEKITIQCEFLLTSDDYAGNGQYDRYHYPVQKNIYQNGNCIETIYYSGEDAYKNEDYFKVLESVKYTYGIPTE